MVTQVVGFTVRVPSVETFGPTATCTGATPTGKVRCASVRHGRANVDTAGPIGPRHQLVDLNPTGAAVRRRRRFAVRKRHIQVAAVRRDRDPGRENAVQRRHFLRVQLAIRADQQRLDVAVVMVDDVHILLVGRNDQTHRVAPLRALEVCRQCQQRARLVVDPILADRAVRVRRACSRGVQHVQKAHRVVPAAGRKAKAHRKRKEKGGGYAGHVVELHAMR